MGKASRNKGKAGEREVARLCREYGYDTKRGQQYSGRGEDDVVGLPGVHIEVKRVERLNLHAAMEQSIRDAKGDIPIVVHRMSREPWMVTMRFEDFMTMFRVSIRTTLADRDYVLSCNSVGDVLFQSAPSTKDSGLFTSLYAVL